MVSRRRDSGHLLYLDEKSKADFILLHSVKKYFKHHDKVVRKCSVNCYGKSLAVGSD